MIYFSLHSENKRHTTRENKPPKARTKDKEKHKYSIKDYKRKSREVNLLGKKAAHQRAKYLKYKKLNKAFAKKKTRKEETVILDDTLDIDSSSIIEDQNSRDEDEEASITYDSELADNDKSSNSSINSEENI